MIFIKTFEELRLVAKECRKDIIKMVSRAQTSHIASALSIIDILVVLYSNILNIDKNHVLKNRDRLILSKGHACVALYAALCENGFLDKDMLNNYCCNDGSLYGHPSSYSSERIDFSTGSLGHGLSVGIGMALCSKFDDLNYRTFVILGDGECNEGQVWEASMFAAQHNLDNLIAIIDSNKLQGFGETKDVISTESLKLKWQSFGWETIEIDGHNLTEINSTLIKLPFSKNSPSLIIANTIKGKGVSFMENKLEWHYKSPSKEQEEAALKEIDSI